jgi:MoaA/NifB/PqqE/SkfB family radical SAM enzyme
MFAQHGSKDQSLLEAHDDLIETMPILVLNVHSRCNCRCLMCDIWKRDEAAEITAATLERHRESLRRLRVEWVVLTGGEPLMHSDLSSLCTFLRELGVRLTLLTTGLLLSRRAAEVAMLFDDVIISLDGPRSVHDAIRRVRGGFDLIQSGVSELRERRPDIRVSGRTTVQRMNHSSLRATVLAAKELGLDGISFLAADLTSEAFNRPLLWPIEKQNEVGLSIEEVSALEDELEALIVTFHDDLRKGYIAESAAKLRKIAAHFRAHLELANATSPRCNAPWVSAVVETNGAVRPCFFHQPIGNLQDGTFEEIINGEAAQAFRRGLDVASNPICRNCVCSLYHA